MEETKIKLYQNQKAMEAFIGTPEKTSWYLSAFKKYDLNGIEKPCWYWSWAAFFLGPWYLLYRKCYLEGIALLVISAFLSSLEGSLYLIVNIVLGGFLPFVYYKRFKKTALEVENIEPNFDKQIQMLGELGGVNKPLLYIGIGISVAFVLFIMLALGS
ncbi:MAG: DUF2628 domain-containing protein [Clostridium chrysemydis]|uniref:DUF2628 domain-containing protein n=1 Tax=Bacteria TaxID=2 RepID=UPI003F3B8237